MLHLDEYVPYLLNRAGARIATAFTALVRERGITLPMWRVLAVLQEEGDLRIGQVAERTSIEVSTLSRVLDGMEERQLVRRRRREDDARSVRLELTEAGRALTLEIVPLAREYEAVAIQGFSAEEAAELKRLLVRLYDNMDRLEEVGRAGLRRAG